MRSYFKSLAFGTLSILVASSALAGEGRIRACHFPLCGGYQDALVETLADRGLTVVDGLSYTEDRAGQGWLTILSTDARGLAKADPTGRAKVVPIDGTVSYSVTIPATMYGLDVGTTPQALDPAFMEFDGIQGETGGGGGGGTSDDDCFVCVCTEDGYECDYVC